MEGGYKREGGTLARTPKTDEELRELAIQIAGNAVFTDRHIPSDEHEHMLGSIFMPLGLSGRDDWQRLLDQDVAMFYQHIHKAGPRSVNGFPCFMSAEWLNSTELETLRCHLTALEEFKQEGSTAEKVPGSSDQA